MNYSRTLLYSFKGEQFIIAIDSGAPDGFKGCYWQLYVIEPGDKLVRIGRGESRGFGPSHDGMGSQHTAERLAKAAARRAMQHVKRKESA